MASMLKKERCKTRAVNYVDMLLMVEKGIRGGMCHAIHKYAKANNKYVTNYNKKSSYIQYLNANDLYGGNVLKIVGL